jgi:hypothetical protein
MLDLLPITITSPFSLDYHAVFPRAKYIAAHLPQTQPPFLSLYTYQLLQSASQLPQSVWFSWL